MNGPDTLIPTPQQAWDLAALTGLIVSGVFTLIRRHMLSGAHGRWHTAAGAVQASLSVQAMFFGYVALAIAFGSHHANSLETVAFLLSGYVSVTMAVNLDRNGRLPLRREPSAAGGANGSAARPEPRRDRSFAPDQRRDPPSL